MARQRVSTPRINGTVEYNPLSMVKPNDWNPNEMTPFMRESLKADLAQGWLASEALLIWGSDEKGNTKQIIIDGEHLHSVGKELGFKKAPMVFLENLPEVEARALTVKLFKRGKFDRKELGALLREIQGELKAKDFSTYLGIDNEELMKLLAEPVLLEQDDLIAKNDTSLGTEIKSSQVNEMRRIPLFFDKKQHAEFSTLMRSAAKRYKTQTVSDTVLEVMRSAYQAP